MSNGGATGMLVVVTGASHVTYGSRGTGLPARISRKIPTKNHVVILLNPEGQYIRREGEVPLADLLWCSAARPCSRNCFDRAEIARLMNAAGRRRDALPQVFRGTFSGYNMNIKQIVELISFNKQRNFFKISLPCSPWK
ncbi:hypothetical protein CsSME_00015125 [Camellia sinensis var. sinensis]